MLSSKASTKSAGDTNKRKVAISANQIVKFEGTSVGFHPRRTKSEQVFEILKYLKAIDKDKVIDFFASVVPAPILQNYQALSQRMLVPRDGQSKGVYSFITREMVKGSCKRDNDSIPYFTFVEFGDKDQIKALLEEMRGWQNDGMQCGHLNCCSNFKDDSREYGATFHKSNLEAMYPNYNMNANFCKEFVVKVIAKKFVICWHFMIPYYGVRLDGSEPTGNGQIADGFVTVLLAKYKDDKYYSFVLAIDHDKNPTDLQKLEMLKDMSILQRLNIPNPFAAVAYTEVTMQNENLLLPSLKLREKIESFNRSSFVAFGYKTKIAIGVRCIGSDGVDCDAIHQAGDGFVRVRDCGGGYFCKTCASSFTHPRCNFEARKRQYLIPIGVRCIGSDGADCDAIHQAGDGFVRVADRGGGYFCGRCASSFRSPRSNFETCKMLKKASKSEPKEGLRRSARLNQKNEPVPNKKRKLG